MKASELIENQLFWIRREKEKLEIILKNLENNILIHNANLKLNPTSTTYKRNVDEYKNKIGALEFEIELVSEIEKTLRKGLEKNV